MTEQITHEIEITAPSIEVLKELLETTGELDEGMQRPLTPDATLQISELSKSSGFDATTVMLTGIVSIAVSTTSALLTEWLKQKLLKKKESGKDIKGITIVIDGKKIEISQSG